MFAASCCPATNAAGETVAVLGSGPTLKRKDRLAKRETTNPSTASSISNLSSTHLLKVEEDKSV